MKIAVFSDVHGNLPALKSFFEDLDKINPDMIFCLGDLVGYNPWPNEVVDIVRKRKIPTIMGNHDEFLLLPEDLVSNSNKAITRRLVNKFNKDYLVSLPRHLDLEFQLNNAPFKMHFTHGSPKAINDYLVEDYPEDEALQLLDQVNSDLILCGHTHKQYHRIINSKDGFKHIINVGSVGKPKDSDSRLCYAVLTFTDNPALYKQKLTVEFRRKTYDLESAMAAIISSAYPNAYAQALKDAK